MPYVQESLLPNHHQKDYYDDVPKTTNIGWFKNYFRGHFLPSIKRKIFVIIIFFIFLLIILTSQNHNNNEYTDDDDSNMNDKNLNDNKSSSSSNSLIEHHDKYFLSNSNSEKFLTYLPHGNIFKQKDELKNAIFLSYSLNRTLIIPPIILGLDVDEFKNFYLLQNKLTSLRSLNTRHQSECFVKTIIPEQKETKYEIDITCLNDKFNSYSLLSWDNLFNLNLIKNYVHILHGNDFDQLKLENMLNITNSNLDVYEITKSCLKGDQCTLNSIRSRNEKLLIFDYLSGFDLIDSIDSNDLLFLNQIYHSLELDNPIILKVSKNIIEKLGGKKNYIGVHARFHSNVSYSKKFIRDSFSNLTSTLKNYKTPPQNHINNLLCEKRNGPIIYLATDLSRNDSILSSFLSEFSCVTMLNDFNEILIPLFELYNSRDNSFLFKFLEPFVNSIVASNGLELFTLDDGIYSEYAKKLHGVGVKNKL